MQLQLNKFRERHREKQRETLSIRPGLEVFLKGRRFSSTDQSSGSLKGVAVVVTNCNWLSLRLLGSSSFLPALSVRSGIGFDDCDDFPPFFLFMVTELSLCSPLFQQNEKHKSKRRNWLGELTSIGQSTFLIVKSFDFVYFIGPWLGGFKLATWLHPIRRGCFTNALFLRQLSSSSPGC